MKKQNFFLFILSSLMLSMGFSSCKDCDNCFRYTDDYGDTYTYCQSEFENEAQYEAYMTIIQAFGYTIEEFEICD